MNDIKILIVSLLGIIICSPLFILLTILFIGFMLLITILGVISLNKDFIDSVLNAVSEKLE